MAGGLPQGAVTSRENPRRQQRALQLVSSATQGQLGEDAVGLGDKHFLPCAWSGRERDGGKVKMKQAGEGGHFERYRSVSSLRCTLETIIMLHVNGNLKTKSFKINREAKRKRRRENGAPGGPLALGCQECFHNPSNWS